MLGYAHRVRRHEFFPADRGLQARMVLVSVLTPLVIVALFVAAALLLKTSWFLGFVAVAALGVFKTVRDGRKGPPIRLLKEGQEPELQAIVERLCVTADLPKPDLVVEADAQPNSWVVDAPRRRPRLHVTRGLLDLLEPVELEAVVAHELSHVAHRDATVMTVVALPVTALLRGGDGSAYFGLPGIIGSQASWVAGFVAGFGSTALSRYRELTADAGAVALTGKPAALASALMKVSGAVGRVPSEDLRLAARCDALHLVGVEEVEGLRRLHGPTHPSIARRVAALERLEHRVAHGRRA
jgi:heat shock protein HtpX